MNKKNFHFISKRELVLILVLLAIAAAAAFLPEFFRKKGRYAVIQCGSLSKTVSLSDTGEFRLDGFGDALFEISEEGIRIKDASCPDKICVNTGFISSPGQCIVCAPQKIVITVEGSSQETEAPDAIVG